MPTRWTDDELKACVVSYRAMLSKEVAGEKYEKSAVRRHLTSGPLSGRSATSIEWRMRNISSVLENRGHRYIPGYLPAANTGSDVSRRIEKILDEVAADDGSSFVASTMPRMVFFNVGWMKNYQGMSPDDPTLGRHGYLREHAHGLESFNFLPEDGRMFGYQPRTDKIWPPKLGGSPKAETVEHILVVWLATHPVSMTVLVVGWYKDATVYRTPIARVPTRGDGAGQYEIPYTVETRAENATLLPAPTRSFKAHTHHSMVGGLGQSPVWYGGNDDFRLRVWRYIQEVDRNLSLPKVPPRGKGKPPRNPDPELRRKVEKAAIKHATEFFTSNAGGGYDVESFEVEGRGWDLEATRGDEKLLIEVKGLSGNRGICELTPNEYAKSKHSEHRPHYVIYIVGNCLSDTPVPSIFRYTVRGIWETDDGRRLSVDPVVGARLTIRESIGSGTAE
ncbi:MAG: DUF3883 domain-containing protein [Mesorhizobium sp.]|nr:MAG: DUF3883 domain-containing protein [Mesorhizobium sp.]